MVKKPRSVNQRSRDDLVYRTLLEHKTMSVAEIQSLLDVSPMTARRCLDNLQAEGLIKRVHGGATVVDLWGRDTQFQKRVMHRSEVKAKLVSYALRFMPDNGSIFLDAGTTCYEMAKQINANGGSGTVITDSIAAAMELRSSKNYKAILIGGEIAEDGNSMDGTLAAEFVTKFSVDVLFFSASGFNDEHLENSVLAGTYIKRLLAPQAQKTVCVIDSGKYCKQRCFRVFGWEEVDVLVTDAGLPQQAQNAIRAKGVDIHLVEV